MINVKEMLNKMLLVAKEDRARIAYSNDEGFVPKVIVIGPNDEVVVTPAGWRNEQQKYANMHLVSEAAKHSMAQAVVVISDACWLESGPFCEHYNLAEPNSTEPWDVKNFEKRYLEILAEHGGQMKNLPRHLWNEAVIVAMNGPRCGAHVVTAPYDQGPGDTVHYLPGQWPKLKEGETIKTGHLILIPAWWQ